MGYGPTWYRHNEAPPATDGLPSLGLHRGVGGLGTQIKARRQSGGPQRECSSLLWSSTPILDLKPYLKPLPAESRSEADVRQTSLKAYIEALGMHLQKKG